MRPRRDISGAILGVPIKMLRSLLKTCPRPLYLMEAHNGISARIAEEAGFEALWGSGLTISASRGMRDANELSVSQVVGTAGEIQAAVDIPVLLDGDTGFGNFNNARRLVTDLERLGVGGVCLEDKLFPKTNSFVGSEKQALADKLEFGLKIAACKDAQRTEDFCVVARLESFITGNGLDDALERARVYKDHGADAILCHSKRDDAQDIASFMDRWGPHASSCPVLVVPTTYPSVPSSVFYNLGVAGVIWANHSLRASVLAMEDTCRRIAHQRSILETEALVAPVSEVFRLQRQEALTRDEKRFLPEGRGSSRTYGPGHYLTD